ncbi:hypothetical protein ACFLZ5_00600 [Thermodesulfobacteriota bacterium]
MQYKTFSFQILQSYRNKVTHLFNKSNRSEAETAELLINLHFVLELGLNILFSNLAPIMCVQKIPGFDKESISHNAGLQLNDKIIEDVDSVSYLQKTIMFIYFTRFQVKTIDELNELSNHYKIVGKIKKFNETRNKLVHGHSIHTIHKENEQIMSQAKKKLSTKNVNEQIELFKSILKSMEFFLMNLHFPAFTQEGREILKELYLNGEFFTEK